MAFINQASREINVKIVYYGPASLAEPNVKYIYDRTNPELRGELQHFESPNGTRLSFFDFKPAALGEIRGFATRFHLYYGVNLTPAERATLLRGADGIVFVASTLKDRLEGSIEWWNALGHDLSELGVSRDRLPLVVQLGDREHSNTASVDEVKTHLGLTNQPVIEAIPAHGTGVFDAMKGIARLVLMALRNSA